MITTTSASDGKEPYNVVMDITPSQAFAWLEGNTHNRPLDQAHVERLARDMKAGRWRLTLLVDGQHRLWAVIEADVTVPMRVFFNEPPESRHVLDTGGRVQAHGFIPQAIGCKSRRRILSTGSNGAD